MKNLAFILVFGFVVVLELGSCIPDEKSNGTRPPDLDKGSFGYDAEFLMKYYKNSLVLSDGQAKLIVTPELQGRVMTSTVGGNKGQSFGWINYELISSGKTVEHFNPVGGEERFWLGPEGGQFSIFFKPGTSFDFENWYVPNEVDIEPFDLISNTDTEARFQKQMKLLNYSNTVYDLTVDRVVSLLTRAEASKILGTNIPIDLKMIGFETKNTITNTGENTWDKNSGMPSVWILSMLKPSDQTTVIIPFMTGDTTELGKIVTDNYFGKVGSDRLVVNDRTLFFKADGKKRGKIGVSPQRALPVVGSYDPENNLLTIVQYSLSEDNNDYVNSLWEMQDEPFLGDAVNAYNDGPLEDGSILGPFYEIESSSPAAHLSPGQSLTHFHRTFHFKGAFEQLNELANASLFTDLVEITNAF